MIYVDYREGSKHLAAPLRKKGLEVQVVDLPFGDVSFEGRGVGDKPVQIGVELKRLNDLVSSLRSGRLVDHQIPGMVGPGGLYKYAWVVAEGQYRTNKYAQLLAHTGKGWRAVPGKMTVPELEKRMLTIEMSGVHVRFTNREEDTVAFLTNLYHWWNDKALDDHATMLSVHQPGGLIPMSDFRATLMVRCPHMGRAASLAAEVHFNGNLKLAAMATVNDWANITMTDRRGTVKRLGMARATDIVNFWKGV